MPKPRIMFYHDGRHPLIYRYEPPMQKEEFEIAVDDLAGTPVEALMFCLGDGRTVLHDTQVGELWGHNVTEWPHLVFLRAHRNAVALIEGGHDPLRLICDRAHAKGMLVYPTLLVQQGRGQRGDDVRCSEFRFQHTELEIGARGDLDPNYRGRTCLDFKHEQVRGERLALIQEVLDNYAIDGFELQLNYWPYYFYPDEVEAGRPIMTAWVRQVYEAVKGSGPERELAIRVPARVEECLRAGLDVPTWLSEGIVDVLIGQTLARGELLDPMADFRSLVKAAAGTGCRVHAALHSRVDSDRLGDATTEMIRAAACNYWAQGIDGLYLAHWFSSWPYQASFYEKLRELPHPDVMAPRDKYYFVATITDRYPQPVQEPGTTAELPVALEVGQPTEVTFTIGDDLLRWHEVGRVHQVLLRVRLRNATERDRLSFQLNGIALPDAGLRVINETYRMWAPRYRTGSCYWFVYQLDRDHWPLQGRNTLQVTLLERDAEVIPEVHVRDMELEVQYLLGKHAPRGYDADLGPYECAGF